MIKRPEFIPECEKKQYPNKPITNLNVMTNIIGSDRDASVEGTLSNEQLNLIFNIHDLNPKEIEEALETIQEEIEVESQERQDSDLFLSQKIDEVHSDILWKKGSGENSVQTKGTGCSAIGINTVAEGLNTVANSDYSHAEGYASKTVIDPDDSDGHGQASHAEGTGTVAKGTSSHAEGGGTLARGRDSHAEGNSTSAMGDASHAEGNWTITNNFAEHAGGTFNLSHMESASFGDEGNTLYSIGIGKSTGELKDDRKNAFEIMQNGDAYFINVGNYDGTNPAEANSLQEIIEDKVSFSDYATDDKSGVIKTGIYGTALDNNNRLQAQVVEAEELQEQPEEFFISKGTLDNVVLHVDEEFEAEIKRLDKIKADKTDVQSKVNNLQSQINLLSDEKADKTELTEQINIVNQTISTEVSTLNTKINETKDSLETKIADEIAVVNNKITNLDNIKADKESVDILTKDMTNIKNNVEKIEFILNDDSVITKYVFAGHPFQ